MRISTTSEGWKIRRLKKWPNGSGRNWSLNVPGFARSPCTKHRQRGASIAANKKSTPSLVLNLSAHVNSEDRPDFSSSHFKRESCAARWSRWVNSIATWAESAQIRFVFAPLTGFLVSVSETENSCFTARWTRSEERRVGKECRYRELTE